MVSTWNRPSWPHDWDTVTYCMDLLHPPKPIAALWQWDVCIYIYCRMWAMNEIFGEFFVKALPLSEQWTAVSQLYTGCFLGTVAVVIMFASAICVVIPSPPAPPSLCTSITIHIVLMHHWYHCTRQLHVCIISNSINMWIQWICCRILQVICASHCFHMFRYPWCWSLPTLLSIAHSGKLRALTTLNFHILYKKLKLTVTSYTSELCLRLCVDHEHQFTPIPITVIYTNSFTCCSYLAHSFAHSCHRTIGPSLPPRLPSQFYW